VYIANPNSVLLREPGLLVPGRKPTGPVRIDWAHPLTRGLAVCTVFQDRFPKELTTGLVVNLRNEIHQVQNRLVGDDTTDNVAYFQAPLLYGSANVSTVWSGQIDTWGTNTALWGIPYSNSAWVSPYLAFGFARDSTNDRMKAFYARSGGGFSQEFSNTGYIITATPVTYGLTMRPGSGGSARFFLDGDFHSVDSSLASTAAIDWGGNNDLCVCGSDRYGNNSGSESIQGYCEYLYIYNRLLSDWEHAELYRDPYQFLVPV